MIEELVELIRTAGNDREAIAQTVVLTRKLPTELRAEFIERLYGQAESLSESSSAADSTIMELAHLNDSIQPSEFEAIRKLYSALRPDSSLRNCLLHWLGSDGSEQALGTWCDLITESPPSNPHALVQSFGPLFKNSELPHWFFDELATKGIAHPEIASAALDLMNFHTREKNIDGHPAIQRADQLTSLLGNVVQQMARVEEGNLPSDLTPQEISQRVSESVALTISLCDAVALMDHEPAIGKLHQALQLKHRRIRTEAAAALARLDIEEGRESLSKLAEEPIARLRVLAFAEELGILDSIPEEHQNEIAIAESKLASWLAEPAQMGLAPSEISMIDNRELYWPGFEHPVLCYLFRFRYGTEPSFTNLGISGPMTHAFAVNIESLSIDDSYAAFAGWQAVHPDIFQLGMDKARALHGKTVQELTDRLHEKDFTDFQPEFVGSFFGDLIVVGKPFEAKNSRCSLIAAKSTASQANRTRIESIPRWHLRFGVAVNCLTNSISMLNSWISTRSHDSTLRS